jgi:SAM-dependent methyltransferase
MKKDAGELAFSSKYNQSHSEAYYKKHKQGFWRNFSNKREIACARAALQAAGTPTSILDLPCGAGRFWELLVESGATELTAADYSADMLEVARTSQPEELASRFTLLNTSAFDIDLPDNAVDCIFCMRLIHHVGTTEDRLRILKEFSRVTRETVCISLWVDGNYQSWRRKRLEAKRQEKGYQNRFVVPTKDIGVKGVGAFM